MASGKSKYLGNLENPATGQADLGSTVDLLCTPWTGLVYDIDRDSVDSVHELFLKYLLCVAVCAWVSLNRSYSKYHQFET